MNAVVSSRLRPRDVVAVGVIGPRGRPLRAVLTAAGIAIGIATMVAVLGITASGRADLLATLDRLGTELLQVTPGQSITSGEDAELPESAPATLRRLESVDGASATAALSTSVRRSDLIPDGETGGIRVLAVEGNLLDPVRGRVREGVFLNDAMARYPAVVLGSAAAEHLGIADLRHRPAVDIGGQRFSVVGLLDPLPLTPELNRAALVGRQVAADRFGFEGSPSTVYVRAEPDRVEATADLLPRAADPQDPRRVSVSRPSDALVARAAADQAFTALLLGLGGVALLVGGIGIANVMVISVLERRQEIGIRRALGATRRHVRLQFFLEAVFLSVAGGAVGVALGAAIASGYAQWRGWTVALPLTALLGGVAVAVAVGALAGIYPASRAARLAPADAVRT